MGALNTSERFRRCPRSQLRSVQQQHIAIETGRFVCGSWSVVPIDRMSMPVSVKTILFGRIRIQISLFVE